MIAKMKEMVRLLKKHRRMGWVTTDLFWVAVVIVLSVIERDWGVFLFTLPLVMMIAWEISDADMLEQIDLKNAEIKEQGKHIEDLKGDLSIASDLLSNNKANPIKSNRIVSDKTFAVRFRNFLKELKPLDPASEEELVYLTHVAEKLLSWQTKTVRRLSIEAEYMQRLGLMPTEPETEPSSTPEAPRKTASAKKKKKAKKEVTTEQAPEANENQN